MLDQLPAHLHAALVVPDALEGRRGQVTDIDPDEGGAQISFRRHGSMHRTGTGQRRDQSGIGTTKRRLNRCDDLRRNIEPARRERSKTTGLTREDVEERLSD